MTRVKSLLQTAPEPVLDFACDLVIEEICNYCNLPEVPDQLLNTAALMVRALQQYTAERRADAAGGQGRVARRYVLFFRVRCRADGSACLLGRFPDGLPRAVERFSEDAEVMACWAILIWSANGSR